jgi:FAS-associated factor 2
VWAVSVNTEEGARVSNIFRENTFPFLVLVGLRAGRMCVCERVEGRVGRGEVEERLQRAIRGHEAEMVAERAERERRNTDKRLREEQDRAFAASLEADKAKKKEREQQLAEEEERVALEREREEMEQRKEEEFAAELRLRRSRLPPEPTSSDASSTVLISLRLPSGERMERRFSTSDQLQSLYDFAYTSDSVPQRFTLVTNFPKKELHCTEQGGPTLDQLALGPKCVIFMKNDSD